MSRQYNGRLMPVYGTGCDKVVNGKRESFCDDCEKCPFPKGCRAQPTGTSKYRFRLMIGQVSPK